LAAAEEQPEAIRQYTACVVDFPDSFEARYNLGGLLRRGDRAGEALEHLEAAVRLRPDDFDAHVELGLAHMALDDTAAARRALVRAVELDPESPESVYHLRGLIQRLDEARPPE
jgi:Flp pilus assembly protein TadD